LRGLALLAERVDVVYVVLMKLAGALTVVVAAQEEKYFLLIFTFDYIIIPILFLPIP
jgi:hypothetical protein